MPTASPRPEPRPARRLHAETPTRRSSVVTLLCGALLLGAALLPTAALANEAKNFSLGLSAAIGGPFESDGGDPGLTNNGVSAHFAWRTQPQTKVVLRVAQIDTGEEVFGTFLDSELSYVNIGGEYTFQEPYYTSGLYAGLGFYRVDGTLLSTGLDEEDTSIGFVLGVTADFPINDRFSVFADLSFHYADLEPGQFFGFLHAGVAYHF